MSLKLNLLNRRLSPEFRKILKNISKIGERLKIKLYLVGGSVRDLLLNKTTIDFDLLLDSNLDRFLKHFSKEYNLKVKKTSFLTAKVYFKNASIDIAQARKEIYPRPGVLPLVQPGSLEEDARRRDFTINALMLRVSSGKFVEFVDYVGGLKDLKRGVIRVLYEESFWDDPTRIIRALRYEKRFNFKLESKTLSLLQKAISENVLNTVSPQRLGAEFLRTLKEEEVSEQILRLAEFKVFSFLSERIELSREALKLLKKWDEFKKGREINYFWLIPLFIVLKGLEFKNLEPLISILELSRSERKIIHTLWKMEALEILATISKRLSRDMIYDKLKNLNLHQIIYLYLLARNRARSNLKKFLDEISKLRLEITGEEIKRLGVSEGPGIGRLLDEVLKAKIRGEVKHRREEIRYLKKLIRDKNVDRLFRN